MNLPFDAVQYTDPSLPPTEKRSKNNSLHNKQRLNTKMVPGKLFTPFVTPSVPWFGAGLAADDPAIQAQGTPAAKPGGATGGAFGAATGGALGAATGGATGGAFGAVTGGTTGGEIGAATGGTT